MTEFVKKELLVSIKNVSKSFGKKLIIRDIGTEENPFIVNNIVRPNMEQGQTIGIVGASGSGKSTLFKLIAGIDSTTTGTIQIPHPDQPEIYRGVEAGDIGFVQQSYPLSRNESVYSMLNDAAIQGKIQKKDRKAVIENYLESWNLKDQRFQSKNQLSGGQKQRVAIIEQLLCSHHFIIFDEPFSGLDVRNIEDVKKSFQKITTSDSLNTIFFSTHDLHLAVELSDTIFVMGYEKTEAGVLIPGGTIIHKFDLMELGLAWIGYSPGHHELATQIDYIIKH